MQNIGKVMTHHLQQRQNNTFESSISHFFFYGNTFQHSKIKVKTALKVRF